MLSDGVKPDSGRAPDRLPVGKFEQLPKWLKLIPIVAQWIWLGLRYRSITLPAVANPHITAGGMVGEGKLEYFASMGALARAATADYVGIHIDDNSSAKNALKAMEKAGLEFPVVVKPDLGWCGYGVRLLASHDELDSYVRSYPRGQTAVLQRYFPEEGEAGLFYMRNPDAPKGCLIGILLRHFPSVTGNGNDTIAELIAKDKRLRRATHNKMHDCRYNPIYIPAPGEKVRLSTIASTRVGGLYEDASHEATAQLTERVDQIAQDMKAFHAGRFDVRYANLEELRQGKFMIMEVNGAGSEAVHAWDPKYSIREAYQIIFAKQRLLFKISSINRRAGHKPIGIFKLARLHFKQQGLMRLYPPSN